MNESENGLCTFCAEILNADLKPTTNRKRKLMKLEMKTHTRGKGMLKEKRKLCKTI